MGQTRFGRASCVALVWALVAANVATAQAGAGDPGKVGEGAPADPGSTALEIPGSPPAGPIGTSGHFLPAEGYMVVVPTGPAVLPSGETRIEVQQSFSNTLSLSDSLVDFVEDPKRQHRTTPEEVVAHAPRSGKGVDYLADGEVERTDLLVRRGIGHGVELTADLPLLQVGDGFLDGFIEGFHKTFSIKKSDRFAFERNRYLVYLRSGDRTVARTQEPGWGLGDLVLGAKVTLPVPPGLPAGFDLAAAGLVKLPTGDKDRLFSSGSADVGFQLLGSLPLTRAAAYFNLSVVREGGWKDLGAEAATVFSASAGYERRFRHRWFRHSSIVVELTASESPTKGFGNTQLAEKNYIATLAWKQAVSPTGSFYFAFNENLFSFDDTPDFGFALGFVQKLGVKAGGS